MEIKQPNSALDEILKRIRANLPIQNPLHSFVHNNILMMFEDREFHTALSDAGKLYRANSYWPLYRFLELYKQNRILNQDILKGIDHYLLSYGQLPVAAMMKIGDKDFYYRLALSKLSFNDDDSQPNITDDHLWDLCFNKMQGQSLCLKKSKEWRAKGYWEKYYNESYTSSIHPFIIRLISSYLDQGQGLWQNPFLEDGFWSFFNENVNAVAPYGQIWQKILGEKIANYRSVSPIVIVEKELTRIGIPSSDWESYLTDLLFDLKGWAGMVNKLESEPWQATVKSPKIQLIDYIAAVLLVETAMDEFHAREHSTDLAMIYGREEISDLKTFQLTMALYQITLEFQLDVRWMQNSTTEELIQLIEEIDKAEKIHKIRLWHEAYEHHFYREALNAIAGHRITLNSKPTTKAQVLFCIDDREESLRRHLEEFDPSIKTYGVVGFFGIDMKFRSVAHQRLINQCPPVVNPTRVVSEVAVEKDGAKSFLHFHEIRGQSDLNLYYNSRTLFRGFLSTMFFGVISIFPMFLQVFFPRQSRKLKERFYSFISPRPQTAINLEHDGNEYGYTKKEMATIVASIMDMCGINNNFKELIIILGHGSTSNNNPFRQAYGCGACGGNAGLPNARAFVRMANDKEVREELNILGMKIPSTTFFIAAFHDTCTDDVFYYDSQDLPESHFELLKDCQSSLEEASKRNALERCQRFSSTEAKSSKENAAIHVHERAEDLAQPRPEYGHSSNALAIVGKRDLTKGLFLNRRAFLLTYDWSIDPDGSILNQIVLGGVTVAVNINMDYYFSCVDNDNYGCGSKLPLNLTGLIGVMTGSHSDLRIGLARQMIEIHQPVRNLTIIEAPLQRVLNVFLGHTRLKKILFNHWMRLSVHDPETLKWYIFLNDHFEEFVPELSEIRHFSNSIDLVSHNQELDFAEIDQ